MQKLGSALMATAALTLALGLASVAKATPLNVPTEEFPDLFITFVDVSYTTGSPGTLSVVPGLFGSTVQLDDGSSLYTLTGPGIGLSANIDSSGVFSGGSFFVDGTNSVLGFNSGTLLTGNLIAFGFPDNLAQSQLFEFLFTVTGGDAANLYLGNGATAYIAFPSEPFNGSFDLSFASNSLFGTGPVNILIPEPSTAVLVGLGFLGLLAAARRAKASR